MAKFENNKRNNKEKRDPTITSETKRGIFVIILFTLAGISLLSFFNLAGEAGRLIDHGLKIVLGWSYFLFPLILIILGYLFLNSNKVIKGINYLGLFLCILSFNGLLHLAAPPEEAVKVARLGQGGGYLGLSLGYTFQNIMGFWASLIVLAALLIISLLLMFNTTLSRLAQSGLLIFWPLKKAIEFLGWIKNLFKGGTREEFYQGPSYNEAPEETLPQFSSKSVEIVEEEGGQLKMESSSEAKKSAEMPVRIRRKIDLPINLLSAKTEKPTSGDIDRNLEVIQKTLENFNIPVEMGEVSVGPTVTQFTLKPAEGIKLSSITSLHNDLALALAAHPIRIEAPIPGKSLVGIEVPNQKVAVVQLREILDSDEFRKRKTNLMIALGKDVAGKPWLADLDRMPHLLVAGATGSGKSVCLNSIIMSLLYENGPDDLKFIMVDPKRVELPIYNDIPHLLTPVITDVKKTVNALRWALGEMDRRYELLEKHKKRDIHFYNAEMPDKLPYIIIVVDELADLMVTAVQEVEGAIIRLAQMARAVGIHLVLATQRPSVDIITGLIKANITSRIAFSVASAVDSRTILDTSGAEKLLGRGDMLYISAELSRPKRLQGAFVSDADICRVVEFIKQSSEKPEYQEEIVQKQVGQISGIEFSDGDGDLLFEEARETVVRAGKASASLLQRRLKVGYARAARLLDLMEEQGIIGPADGAKPRDILISSEYGDRIDEPEEMPEIEEGEEEIVEEEEKK
jgi:S-DNA-T family DNA segregation ATPase FtsK/SpoIIIE